MCQKIPYLNLRKAFKKKKINAFSKGVEYSLHPYCAIQTHDCVSNLSRKIIIQIVKDNTNTK